MSERIAPKPRGGFPAVVVVPLEGISVGTHALTKRAEELQSLCQRVMRRLAWWLKETTSTRELPSEQWVETFRYVQACVLGLLKEQRERAKLTAGDHPSDEQLLQQFRDELHKALETFSPEERAYAQKLWGAGNTIPTTSEEQ